MRGKSAPRPLSARSLYIMTNFQLIPNKEIVQLFIDICPELRKAWEEHLEYWGDDDRGDYIDISVLAHFIVDSYKEGNLP